MKSYKLSSLIIILIPTLIIIGLSVNKIYNSNSITKNSPDDTYIYPIYRKNPVVTITTNYKKCGHQIITSRPSQYENEENKVYNLNEYCDKHYYVKLDGNIINVYSPNDMTVILDTIETNINSIPQAELDRLEAGYFINSHDELNTLIDDFTS